MMGSAIASAASAPLWENPTILGINKRAPHVPLRSHTSLQSALAWFQPGGTAHYQGSQHQLSGRLWDFKIYPNPASVPERFWEAPDTEWNKAGASRAYSCRCY